MAIIEIKYFNSFLLKKIKTIVDAATKPAAPYSIENVVSRDDHEIKAVVSEAVIAEKTGAGQTGGAVTVTV